MLYFRNTACFFITASVKRHYGGARLCGRNTEEREHVCPLPPWLAWRPIHRPKGTLTWNLGSGNCSHYDYQSLTVLLLPERIFKKYRSNSIIPFLKAFIFHIGMWSKVFNVTHKNVVIGSLLSR